MFKVTKTQERDFSRNMAKGNENHYLQSDVIHKIKIDNGYAAKIEFIYSFLKKYHTEGYILDLGSGSSGEAEFMASKNYKMVATDINEISLSYSKARSIKFRNAHPDYYAIDAHNMPFANNTFNNVIAFEVLHHFENVEQAIKEIYRVLRPGGKLLCFEPNALNPYRKISEFRDYFRGTIENSFTNKGLRKYLVSAGFRVIENYKYVLPPSNIKKSLVSKMRAKFKDLFYLCTLKFVNFIGSHVFIVEKPSQNHTEELVNNNYLNFDNNLICPLTKTSLIKTDNGYINSLKSIIYPIYEGVPVLIAEEGCKYELCNK